MKISDKEVKKILKELKNDDEQAVANAIIAILKLQYNNRQFLRKIWGKLLDNEQMNKCSNLQTDPLKLKNGDILIG